MKTKTRIEGLIDTTGHGKNIRTLEKTLGISNGTIGHWDTSVPGMSNTIAVANFFGCSIDYLTCRSNNPSINRDLNVLEDAHDSKDNLLDQYLAQFNLADERHKEIISVLQAYLQVYRRA